MCGKIETPLKMRRLVKQDLEAVQELYGTAGRDTVWATHAALQQLLQKGEVWGGFRGEVLVACGVLCPMEAQTPMAQAARGTRLLDGCTVLVLPVLGDALQAAHLLKVMLARVTQRDALAQAAVLLPVKTGAALLPGYFEAGLVMCAMRPMVALRPHYLFLCAQQVQTDGKEGIMIPLQDTLALSRKLENGWCGVAVRANDVQLEKRIL